MWASILSVVGKFVFSKNGAFLIPIFGLLAIVLVWNFDNIVTKLGFETKASLSRQVVTLQFENEKLQTLNKKLVKQIEDLQADQTLKEQVVETFTDSQHKADVSVKEIVASKKERINQINEEAEPRKSAVILPFNNDNPSPVIPVTKADKISDVNITSLNDTYASLFGA